MSVSSCIRRARSSTGTATDAVVDLVVWSGTAQYFRRPKDLPAMARQLLSMQGVPGVEVMINDDSRSEHAQWMQAFAGAKNFFLVHSPDVHEIRGYNRLGKMANSEMVSTKAASSPHRQAGAGHQGHGRATGGHVISGWG
jgi:hypothetical protein